MIPSETSHRSSRRGAIIGATLYFGLGLLVYILLAQPPALFWQLATFGLAGALVGYLGMRHAWGVIGATLGMTICLLGGAIIGDQIGGFIPVEEPGIPMEGKVLRIEGPTVDGKEFDIAEWRGKVVLVDFWATWCLPCVAKIPEVKKIYDRFHKDGFEVVGVSLDREPEPLINFVKRHEIPWPQIFFDDPAKRYWSSPLAQRYDITGIPKVYLVGRDGNVVPHGDNLEADVEKVLAGSDVGAGSEASGVHVGLLRIGLLIGACIGGFFGIHLGDFLERCLRGQRKTVSMS